MVLKLRVILRYLIVTLHLRHDVPAGRDDFGLDETLVRRADCRERRKSIVAAVGRRVAVGHCADRDDVGQVAGHADRLGVGAAITGGGDDDDAGLPRGHDRLVQGIVPVV